MKSFQSTIGVLVLLFLSTLAYGQLTDHYPQKYHHKDLDRPIGDPTTFFNNNSDVYPLNDQAEMQLTSTIPGNEDHRHLRYQQVINGIPVVGAVYTLHEDNGIVISGTGLFYPDQSINNAVTIKPATLREKSEEWFMRHYKDVSEEEIDHVSFELVCMDHVFPKVSGNLVMAHKIEVIGTHPAQRMEYYVDAENGRLIFESSKVMHQAIPGKGVTKYYGVRDITCDSIGPNEILLRDPTRSNGIITQKESGEIWKNTSSYWDFTQTEDEVAVDLHFSMEQFYDMMLSTFDWEGIDNDGGAMISRVSDDKFINAFWNGEYAFFGRGDCNHGPLTTLEVVAHELMHGITDYTSDLIYSSESGAINESMSDVFGKALEYYVDPANFQWYIGKSFLLNPFGSYFRSMVDPHEREHPKMYKGQYWFDGGGVHTNSSVGNHFFYRLAEGGQGVNEAGRSFDFEGVGIDKALQIIFQTQRAYLFPNAGYNDYYEFSLLAAEELYGAGAPEINVVEEAWAVVGLPFTNQGVERDLGVEIVFADQTTCLDNEALSFDIVVTNLGTTEFDPATDDAMIQLDFMDLQMVDEVIPSGASKVYTFDDEIIVDYVGFEVYQVRLNYNRDQNGSNNQGFTFLENLNPNGLDFEIFAFQDQNIICGDDLYIEVGVTNVSCEDLSAGASATITVLDDQQGIEILKKDVILPAIPSQGEYRELILLPKNMNPPVIKFLFDFAVDPNNDNNEYVAIFDALESVVSSFIEDFSTGINSPYFQYVGNSRAEAFTYSNEQFVSFTGRGTQQFFNPCQTAEETVDTRNPQSIAFCLDLSGPPTVSYPELRFDLVQFRNQNGTAFPELLENTCVFKVEWESPQGTGSKYIYGQNEGEVLKHTVQLPGGFKGQVTMSMYTHTGTQSFRPEFLEMDVILLDNIELALLVNNNDLDYKELQVFPNPTSDILQINGDGADDVRSKAIYSLDGRTMLTDEKSSSQVDIGTLQKGMYILVVTFNDGSKGSTRIIRQ